MSSFPPGDRLNPDEVVYRRVPAAPSFVALDFESKNYVLAPAAIQFDDDGVSVHRASILDDSQTSLNEIYDFESVGAVEFLVEQVDAGGGRAWATPSAEVSADGVAHASITGESTFKPSRPERSRISESIRNGAQWVALPPNVRVPAAPLAENVVEADGDVVAI